jgi:hypothetical protein
MWKLGMEVAGEAVEAFRSQLDDILGDTAQEESVAEMENVPSEVVSENSPVLVAASEASASELPSL